MVLSLVLLSKYSVHREVVESEDAYQFRSIIERKMAMDIQALQECFVSSHSVLTFSVRNVNYLTYHVRF